MVRQNRCEKDPMKAHAEVPKLFTSEVQNDIDDAGQELNGCKIDHIEADKCS